MKAIDVNRRIEVKMTDDRIFAVEAEKGTSIAELKQLIGEASHVPANEQLLLHSNGRGNTIQLESDRTVADYYGLIGGTVHLVVRKQKVI